MYSVLIYLWPVPIFDGRISGFKHTPENMAYIHSLPLYKKGCRDLPPDTVVSVGYTVGSFSYTSGAGTGVSFNLLFVVLLGIPVDPKTQVSYDAEKKGGMSQRAFK